MVPAWLTVLSWTAIGVALASAAWIVWDVYGRQHRQQVGVMEAVWPITALYFGPVAVWAYRRSLRQDQKPSMAPGAQLGRAS